VACFQAKKALYRSGVGDGGSAGGGFAHIDVAFIGGGGGFATVVVVVVVVVVADQAGGGGGLNSGAKYFLGAQVGG